MSDYTPPSGAAVELSWLGTADYTAPGGALVVLEWSATGEPPAPDPRVLEVGCAGYWAASGMRQSPVVLGTAAYRQPADVIRLRIRGHPAASGSVSAERLQGYREASSTRLVTWRQASAFSTTAAERMLVKSHRDRSVRARSRASTMHGAGGRVHWRAVDGAEAASRFRWYADLSPRPGVAFRRTVYVPPDRDAIVFSLTPDYVPPSHVIRGILFDYRVPVPAPIPGYADACTQARYLEAVPASPPLVLPWGPVQGVYGYYLGPPGDPVIEPPTEPIIVPIRRFYYVLNIVSLIRIDTEQEVPASDLRLSLDASSWAWAWSVTIPGYAHALVYSAPGASPVELLARVNGHEIRLRVDALNRSRRFGDSSIIASGRGRSAVLAAPTAASVTRSNDAVRTANQLLEDALQDNGVSIGWAIDWQLEDWSVIPGAWNHTGTYMEAATRIAEAGGGYVQGDDVDAILHVMPWYPVPPWHWATVTPDLVLPEDVCLLESIDWTDKPSFAAVWVTGGTGGRRDRIKRAGSSGVLQAGTIVDALATDPVMTRQRGTRVLSDTGRQAEISLRMPVLTETGIIKPGLLVQYTESGNVRLGLTRGVSVEQRFPELWQTVRIESHELE